MYDFIIVGAGSAGSVLASRLSEDPAIRVLLLEAGPARVPLASRIPAAFSKLFRTSVDWAYQTEPEPHLAGRTLFWPRGRMLGGSSAMNAMIWTRPDRADLAEWVALGCVGWSYDDLAPWFDRAEVRLAPGASRLDRIGIPVADLRSPNPLSHVFLEAARASGLGVNAGFGDGDLAGAGWFRVTQAGGRRVSAADGYLTPAVRRRPNLTLAPNAVASAILFDGSRATGIEYRPARGRSTRETGRVVLAAGAIGSPHLLLRSGIGPAAELEAQGLSVRAGLPAVGKHLQDHLAAGIGYACARPVTLAGAETARNLLSYFLRGRGALTSNVAEAGAFVRTTSASAAPDIELLFAPTFFVDHGFGNPAGHGYTIAAVLQHPESRGEILLRSSDPETPPVIRANYLSSAADTDRLLSGLALARRVGEHPAFAPYRKAEVHPGATAALDDHLRHGSQTLYHPVGTCRMGTGDDSVVSDRLAVHGIENLWVADASVMPAIPTGHTHAPVVAIAERAADLVRRAAS